MFSFGQIKDYDAALDLELDSMEKFVLQCLAFYQVWLNIEDIYKLLCLSYFYLVFDLYSYFI